MSTVQISLLSTVSASLISAASPVVYADAQGTAK
jgi:hypothetical protein